MPMFRRVRGMRDFLPAETAKMRYVEETARKVAGLYGYGEVITPIVESYDLLAAKSGKEIRERMYVFNDLGGRKVALRPEFTASVARLMASTLRNEPKPVRLFCVGSLYRYDEPQFGRYREFWQTNFELIGSNKPEADAEILILTNDLMQRLNIQNYWFKIGHMGISRGILAQEGVPTEQQNEIMQLLDKKRWDDAVSLVQSLGVSQKGIATLKKLFETKGKNIAKTLNKTRRYVKDYEEAVAAVENLNEILELTKASGVKLKVSIEAGFARGLEYYTGMITEIFVPKVEVALGGGGRYDKLIELFGGEPTPAVGIAHGVDRIVLAMEKQRVSPNLREERRVVVIAIKKELNPFAIKLASTLRNAGVVVELEVMGRNITRALQDADRRGATHAILIGPEEFKQGKIVLRDMKKREQQTVEIDKVLKELGVS